jgi:hypothetical protein
VHGRDFNHVRCDFVLDMENSRKCKMKIMLVLVLVVVAMLYFYFSYRVPEGWEDENGFHRGRKDE